MFHWQSRPTRRSGRDERRPDLAALVENLEARQLLAYSPLGIPLPDLVVGAVTAPTATWGGPLAVSVNVTNLTSSTTIEPLSLTPGTPSTADALGSTVGVYVLRSPRNLAGAVKIATISVPPILQNSSAVVSATVTLPQRPPGFPGDGGTVYLAFRANDANQFLESDVTNNTSRPTPLKIVAPFPEVSVVGLDVPPVMQPGDTIQPNIRLANLGPADTAPQGPVQVALVASTSRNFNSGSSIVALYTVANIPSQAHVPTQGTALGDANLDPQTNVVTIAGDPVTLPVGPRRYYIGVVVDPYHHLKQIEDVGGLSGRNRLALPLRVGPPIAGLPPAGVLVGGGVGDIPVFPFPFGNLPVGGSAAGVYPPPLSAATNSFGTTGLSSPTVASVATTTISGTVNAPLPPNRMITTVGPSSARARQSLLNTMKASLLASSSTSSGGQNGSPATQAGRKTN